VKNKAIKKPMLNCITIDPTMKIAVFQTTPEAAGRHRHPVVGEPDEAAGVVHKGDDARLPNAQKDVVDDGIGEERRR